MQVEFEWKQGGCCCHPEFVTIQGGRLGSVEFPSSFGKIRHPTEGWILYDTGYSPHFLEETRSFPEKFYAWVTPVTLPPLRSAAEVLRAEGIDPAEVRWILISHFHGDHVAGLRDFPWARFVCLKSAYSCLTRQSRWKNLSQGYLSKLLPDDFGARVQFADDCRRVSLGRDWRPFGDSYDILGDGSLLAVPLPGHAPGQMGLILQTVSGRRIFLAADAAWHSESIRSLRLPHMITRLVQSEFSLYKTTLQQLHELHRRGTDALIVPSHCREFTRGDAF